MNKEKFIEELSKELCMSKNMLTEYITIVGTNKENIKDYAENSSFAIVRKDNDFNVDYTAVMLNNKDIAIKQLQQENEQLNKQLAEKDKKIAELEEELAENENIIDFHMKNNIYNVALKDYSVLAPYPKNMAQIIRNQTCEKIRKKFDNEYYWCYGDNHNTIVINQEDFNIILDQIEQGDE